MKYQKTFITIVVAFLLFACGEAGKKDESTQPIKDAFIEKVETMRAELTSQEKEVTLAGKVVCDPEKTMHYTSLISGVTDRTYFSLGDKVQKGQTLLDIRSADLSTLQSEKIALETEEKIAERELKTAQSMYDDGMLSERDLFEAQGKLKLTQAALNKVRMDISVFGVQNADGTFSIKAPITGYIIDKNASSGTTITEGSEPLFSIADLQTVWVLVNVYAGNMQSVREGMEVEITTLSYPGEVFNGKIHSIPQVFDSDEKVLKARIVMPNPELKLKPEMSVVVKLKNTPAEKCIAVLSDALIFDDNQYFVVVEESDGLFANRPVVLQGHTSRMSFIASGLAEGEKVVVKNQLLIYSGLKGV